MATANEPGIVRNNTSVDEVAQTTIETGPMLSEAPFAHANRTPGLKTGHRTAGSNGSVKGGTRASAGSLARIDVDPPEIESFEVGED